MVFSFIFGGPKRTGSAEEAVQRPPAIFRRLNATAEPFSGKHKETAVFRLSCRACAADAWYVQGHPDPAQEISDADLLPPHRLTCSACGASEVVFDPRTQGFDGVLNGGCSTMEGLPEERTVRGRYLVSLALTYNIELEELRELAKSAGVLPADLFDAIEIDANPLDGQDRLSFSYECS